MPWKLAQAAQNASLHELTTFYTAAEVPVSHLSLWKLINEMQIILFGNSKQL
jgi:hypothetical protein